MGKYMCLDCGSSDVGYQTDYELEVVECDCRKCGFSWLVVYIDDDLEVEE